MHIRPIRTEQDYDRALTEIAKHFEREPEPGTSAADHYNSLAALIAAYEAGRWPIESDLSAPEAPLRHGSQAEKL